MNKLVHLVLVLLPYVIAAQGINNNGGKIVTQSGGFITVTGANGNFVNATNGSDGSIDNDGTISISGNWSNNAANDVFINSNSTGTVIFNGSALQTYGGTKGTIFEDLNVNNSAGVNMAVGAQVNDSLVLTSGAVWLNANTLTIANSSGSAISRNTGYLVSEQTNNSGRVTWNIGTISGAHTVPFGSSGGVYIPFVLDLTAGDIGNMTVSTYATALDNTPYPTTPTLVTHVRNASGADNSLNTVDRFWEVNRTGASGTATLTFTATPAEVGTITNLQAQRWNLPGLGWDAPTAGQSNTATSATAPSIVLWNTYMLSGNNTPLPLQLLAFTAKVNASGFVDLNWTTASEINNDYFTVQRSVDGFNFENIAIVDGAGNSNKTLNYATVDKQPYTGLSYYRLMQTDFDGTNTVFNKVPVNITGNGNISLSVWPLSDAELSVVINGANGKDEELTITDMLGKTIYSTRFKVESEFYRINLHTNKPMARGVYTVTVKGHDNCISKKIIIR